MNAPLVPALTYPFPELPAPGTATEVAAGVHWLRMPLPFALNHINLWALDAGNSWCLIDTGYGVPATFALWETLFAGALAGKPVTQVICTHFHPDHVGTASWLLDRFPAASFHMTEAEYLSTHAARDNAAGFDRASAIRFYAAHGLDSARMKAQETRSNSYAGGVPDAPLSYSRLQDGDEIQIGSRTWKIRTTFGHSPEHATLFCAADNTLISGDQLLPKITTNVSVWANKPDDDPLARFLSSLDYFESLPAATLVLPSHGLPFAGAHPRVAQLRAHHEARLGELLNAMGEPRTAAELIPVLFARPLDDHQFMFAMGEIVAHLNHLWRQGRALRAGSASEGLFFRAI